MNDMSEVNIDAQIVRRHGCRARKKMVEMSNGCLLHAARGLARRDQRLATEKRFDYS